MTLTTCPMPHCAEGWWSVVVLKLVYPDSSSSELVKAQYSMNATESGVESHGSAASSSFV